VFGCLLALFSSLKSLIHLYFNDLNDSGKDYKQIRGRRKERDRLSDTIDFYSKLARDILTAVGFHKKESQKRNSVELVIFTEIANFSSKYHAKYESYIFNCIHSPVFNDQDETLIQRSKPFQSS
jgi:hypothetical protein